MQAAGAQQQVENWQQTLPRRALPIWDSALQELERAQQQGHCETVVQLAAQLVGSQDCLWNDWGGGSPLALYEPAQQCSREHQKYYQAMPHQADQAALMGGRSLAGSLK